MEKLLQKKPKKQSSCFGCFGCDKRKKKANNINSSNWKASLTLSKVITKEDVNKSFVETKFKSTIDSPILELSDIKITIDETTNNSNPDKSELNTNIYKAVESNKDV